MAVRAGDNMVITASSTGKWGLGQGDEFPCCIAAGGSPVKINIFLLLIFIFVKKNINNNYNNIVRHFFKNNNHVFSR